VLGGALHPGYSHVRNAISELTASQAPYRAALAPLYIAYNVLLVGFAVGLWRAYPQNRLLRAAVVLFAAAGLSGIGQVTALPHDSTGTPATAAGTGHAVLAGVSAVLTVICAVVYGVAFRRTAGWPRLSIASFGVAAFLVVIRPVTAASIGKPWMGLFERLTIGAFLAWVVVVSVAVLRRRPRTADPSQVAAVGPAGRQREQTRGGQHGDDRRPQVPVEAGTGEQGGGRVPQPGRQPRADAGHQAGDRQGQE